MSNTMRLAVELTAVDLASTALRATKNRILQLGEAGKQVQRDFDQMVTHLEKGLKFAAGAKWAVNMAKLGVAPAAEMQSAMLDVEMNLMEAGKSGAQLNAELEKVKNTSLDLQKITPFSGVDVTRVENALLKAGVQIEDITAKRGAAWAATGLSTIEGADKLQPEMAAEMLAGIATPFKIPGAKWGDLADTLQKGSAASISSVSELSAGMGNAAQQAAAMKVSVMETVTALSVLAQHNKRGAEAGTGLAGFLSALNPVEKQKREALESLFKTKKNPFFENGRMLPLGKVIDKLRGKFGELNDQQQQAYAKVIFGQEHMASALSLLDREGPGTWEAMTEAMEKQAAMAQKLEVRQRGLDTSLQALAGNAKTTAGMYFEPWLSGLTEMTKKTDALVSKLGDLGKNHPEVKSWASGGIAAGIAGLSGAALYHLARSAWSARKVLKGMGGVKGLLSKLGGTGPGVAEGLTVSAETLGAVAPVFVTNWPQGFTGGGGGKEGPPAGPGMGKKIVEFGKKALPAAGQMAIPTGVAVGVGFGAMEASQWWAGRQTRHASTEDLERLRMRHEVMGGGRESFQYRLISDELSRRMIESSLSSPEHPGGDAGAEDAAKLLPDDPKRLRLISEALSRGVFEASRAAAQVVQSQVDAQKSNTPEGRTMPVTVEVNIDDSRRVITESNSRDVTTKINVRRGRF